MVDKEKPARRDGPGELAPPDEHQEVCQTLECWHVSCGEGLASGWCDRLATATTMMMMLLMMIGLEDRPQTRRIQFNSMPRHTKFRGTLKGPS